MCLNSEMCYFQNILSFHSVEVFLIFCKMSLLMVSITSDCSLGGNKKLIRDEVPCENIY